MRIYISIDLEGITGIYSEEQTNLLGPGYAAARLAMRADLDAALEGCFAAGASDVVVCDGHDAGSNLDVVGLPENVTLVLGSPSPLSMMGGIEESLDAALFLGYHARSGARAAALEHTYVYNVVSASLGDLEVGEFGLNALLAGHFGVPVVFVSGDDKIAAEAAELVPGIEAAIVKTSLARTCVRALSPVVAERRVREGVRRALAASRPVAPLAWSGAPLRVVFTRAHFCDVAETCPGTRRLDGRTIEIGGASYLELFTTFIACLALAETAGPPSS
jgi:D-amino peptidase